MRICDAVEIVFELMADGLEKLMADSSALNARNVHALHVFFQRLRQHRRQGGWGKKVRSHSNCLAYHTCASNN